jgi:hypothetical protein
MVLMRAGRERKKYTAVTNKYTKAKRGNPEQQVTKMNWGSKKKKK